MDRAYYSQSIPDFVTGSSEAILDRLKVGQADSGFSLQDTQTEAWRKEIEYLQKVLAGRSGSLYLEFSIPRMGLRIDAVLLIGPVIFIVEFKVGERRFLRADIDQVWDYALDLKNFHETSHHPLVVPVLVATEATSTPWRPGSGTRGPDGLFEPICATLDTFPEVVSTLLRESTGDEVDRSLWEAGRYKPTPTIIEAAIALYERHSVIDIARNDAGAMNLARTSGTLDEIIRETQDRGKKSIVFVTGVPGAGKTLVGLNAAIQHFRKEDHLYSVYLSGNGPLVKVLCEALARDRVRWTEAHGDRLKLSAARSEAKAFIQNVHHFRDEYHRDTDRPPIEHVAIFDEAQRAWTREKTSDFMRRRKGVPDFDFSEPAFLISCLDRHPDWAVVVCLVGGGQEINTGEAGIGEWIAALDQSFPHWEIHLPSRLQDREYAAGDALRALEGRAGVSRKEELHLASSLRSFRAENVSSMVKFLLDRDGERARESFLASPKYPIVLTRSLPRAKQWLRQQARGNERYGIVVSSQAERLRPHAIAVRSPVDPVHWFLDPKEDVRSSYYLEDVATEFNVQGLELDWTCVAWDADLRAHGEEWEHWSFRGDRWERIKKPLRQQYLQNAYRVLLTRARQGMVLVVPEGDPSDATRKPDFYDPTFDYLRGIGFPVL